MTKVNKNISKIKLILLFLIDRILSIKNLIRGAIGLQYASFRLKSYQNRIAKYRKHLDYLWDLIPQVKADKRQAEINKLRKIERNMLKEEKIMGDLAVEINHFKKEFSQLIKLYFTWPKN